MLIGTARSDKHLHVSADRLCRWLRSAYQIKPVADGLLGRNELKIQQRRRAKKAKLLGAASGGSAGSDIRPLDEEYRTGWVCVNIGRVTGGELGDRAETKQPLEGFVGFGEEAAGSVVVVQLMTEEKRGLVDLEALWGDMLDRQRRKDRRIEEDQLEEVASQSVSAAAAESSPTSAERPAEVI